jgi:hypothetical protein
MVGWECPTKPREASGLDPEAVHCDIVCFERNSSVYAEQNLIRQLL